MWPGWNLANASSFPVHFWNASTWAAWPKWIKSHKPSSNGPLRYFQSHSGHLCARPQERSYEPAAKSQGMILP